MKSFRNYLFRFGVILGCLLLLYQAIRGIEAFVSNKVFFYSPYLALLAFIIPLFCIFQQIISWKMMMVSIGVNIPIAKAFRGYILSFLPRYLPGSIWGYFSRAGWLNQDFSIPYPVSNAGSFLEVIISVVSTGVMAGIYLVGKMSEGQKYAIMLVPFLLIPISWLIFRAIGNVNISSSFINKGIRLECFKNIKFSPYIFSVILICTNWLLYGYALILLARSLNIPLGTFFFNNWILLSEIYSFSWLLGFLVVFIPGGMGIREITLSSLLVSYFSLTSLQSSAFAVLFRLILVLAEITWVFGAVAGKPLQSLKRVN